jgi:hypothetical protein
MRGFIALKAELSPYYSLIKKWSPNPAKPEMKIEY